MEKMQQDYSLFGGKEKLPEYLFLQFPAGLKYGDRK